MHYHVHMKSFILQVLKIKIFGSIPSYFTVPVWFSVSFFLEPQVPSRNKSICIYYPYTSYREFWSHFLQTQSSFFKMLSYHTDENIQIYVAYDFAMLQKYDQYFVSVSVAFQPSEMNFFERFLVWFSTKLHNNRTYLLRMVNFQKQIFLSVFCATFFNVWISFYFTLSIFESTINTNSALITHKE
jgi:hypothetical protein